MVNEGELLFQLKAKQKNSINRAIEVYTPYLSTVLYNMAGNRLPKEDVEEIISDVFVALWKNAENVDLKKGTLRAYLAAAARNFALKRLNKINLCVSRGGVEMPDEEDFADNSVYADAVWNAVMSLGEPSCEIFVRYYKFGEKIKDISKAMRLNISTVKTKLSRGKIKLRKILSDAEELL